MNAWQQEQESKEKKRKERLGDLAAKLKTPLKAEGLEVGLTKSLIGGRETGTQRIVITLPGFPMFWAMIHIWQGDEKAHFSFEEDHQVSTEIKSSLLFSTGYSTHTDTRKYSLTSPLSDEELISCGFEKTADWRRMELAQFRREFKADKNLKLILNDILPGLRVYREVVKLAEPRIRERIRKELEIFELQKKVAAMTEHKHIPQKVGSYDFTVKGVGKIAISEHGGIELEKSITVEDLKNLLGLK